MAELIRDDAAWAYQGLHGGVSTRRLRAWRDDDGLLVVTVTERAGDSGTSITNAAEMVLAQIAVEFGEPADVIEHYAPRRTPGAGEMDSELTWTLTSLGPDGVTYLDLPPQPAAQSATYELVSLGPTGRVCWSQLTRLDVVERLGCDLAD